MTATITYTELLTLPRWLLGTAGGADRPRTGKRNCRMSADQSILLICR